MKPAGLLGLGLYELLGLGWVWLVVPGLCLIFSSIWLPLAMGPAEYCHGVLTVGGTGEVDMLGAGDVCSWCRGSGAFKEMWQTSLSTARLCPPGKVWTAGVGLGQGCIKYWPHSDPDGENPV